MGLSSRWDRLAAASFILLSVAAMTGCLALPATKAPANNGSVSAGTANLDFGTAVVGASKQLTDTLTNSSTATVTIASAMSSDPSFQVTAPAMPFNLVPGQSADLTVVFTPHAAGKPLGKLSISTSALAAGTISVAVTGSAVAAGTLEVSPASISFGTVAVGQSMAKTAALKNSGGTSVTVSQASVSSSAFTINGLTLPVTLSAGQSTSFTVTFAPKTLGAANGSVAVSGSASLTMSAASGSSGPPAAATSTSLPVAGDATSAGQLTVSPVSVAFGSVPVGTTQSQSVTITNSGGTSATISQATATGSGVTISGLPLPLTLPPSQSSTFQVTFSPTSPGAVTGGIAVISSATNSNLAVAVTGTAVSAGALVLAPTSVSFGNVQVGTSQSQPATITNSGGSNVTITKATASGAGFGVSGLVLPLTLTPGQSSTFTLSFAPQASGSVTGGVAFTSNVATATLPLSGAGQPLGGLAANPANVSFGNIQVGTNRTQTVAVTNSGSSTVTISQASASGTGFSLTGPTLPTTLTTGQSASFTATFAPAAAGNATGSIAIMSNATNPSLSIVLSGTGVTAGALSSNPNSIAFGSVQVGGTLSRSEILTNTGGSLLHISTASVTGAGFATSGLTTPTTLNPGQSLTFTATFTPQSSGAASGSLALTADGSVTSLSIAFTGTGAAPGTLAVSPATVNFGNVTVGASQNQSGAISASGAGVTVSSVASSNPEFTITGLSLPLTLNSGQSAPFTLTFTPRASGAASATLTFSSNATNASLAESLAGTGAAPPQHSVSLGWTASTSTVAGYNVYRGTQSGGPYAVLNGSPDASTSYTDTSVQAGQTYYYVVTAVDNAGVESVFSNQAQAVIPTP
jgi:hypothetical protein